MRLQIAALEDHVAVLQSLTTWSQQAAIDEVRAPAAPPNDPSARTRAVLYAGRRLVCAYPCRRCVPRPAAVTPAVCVAPCRVHQMAVLTSSGALPMLFRNLLSTPASQDLERQLRDLVEAVFGNGMAPEVLQQFKSVIHTAASQVASTVKSNTANFATLASDASLR